MPETSIPRILYAANRALGVSCLRALMKAGMTPVALLLAAGPEAEGAEEMKTLAPGVLTLEGKAAAQGAMETLSDLHPDYLLSIHYPYIIPQRILDIPSKGALNLHPAFLPYNRGWHTPSWAILEGTPYGATLHWIDAGVDTGPIALQKQIDVRDEDTAHALYQRALRAEEDVFMEALPLLLKNALPKIPQKGEGTSHKKAELEHVRRLDPAMPKEQQQRIIRALTTNRPEEAAYREVDGKRTTVRFEPYA